MKHLLGIDHLTQKQIQTALDRARYYDKALKNGEWNKDLLKDKIILSLFFENSTRTAVSFSIAAKRLGAQVITWNASTSSLKKDESFADTVDTLAAMKPDAVIIRHNEHGAPVFVSERVSCPVINAGDSWREHPTQALLDALTIIQEKGSLEGLTVAICGDIAHSRVARSNMILLDKMGAHVRVIAPEGLMPDDFPIKDVRAYASLEDGLPGADVVMMLRIQKERMNKSDIPDDATYHKAFGLNHERLTLAKPDAMVLHPGPINRGVELTGAVADDPAHSFILKQVANGIPTRMAVLDLLMGT